MKEINGENPSVIATIETLSQALADEKDKALSTQSATDAVWKKKASQPKRKPATSFSDTSQLPFTVVEPCAGPIKPDELLDEVASLMKRFVVMDEDQINAAALWVAFTWFTDVVEVAPLAIINAPERECGKSQLLSMFSKLSCRPLSASNTTAAALFRSIDKWHPTVLIDEADTFIKENGELKGLINGGYTRSSAFVLRVIGDNHEPKVFDVWGAKALAGISLDRHLQDTTMSRGIIFELRRKLPHEKVERLRHADKNAFVRLPSKLARFSHDFADQVKQSRPRLPESLSDREQDNWDPLFAVALCAGEKWMKKATTAALAFSAAQKATASTGAELLGDIQSVFAELHTDRISSSRLINKLTGDDDKPWATYNRGKCITSSQIAKKLKSFGISPQNIRQDGTVLKGYKLEDFADSFERYVDIARSPVSNFAATALQFE